MVDKPKEIVTAKSDVSTKAKYISRSMSAYSREIVTQKGIDQYEKYQKEGTKETAITKADPLFKMMTLYEFDNGHLLSCGFSEEIRVLVINLSNQLQEEFDCKNPSELATAHLTAQSYARTLELQKYINMLMDRESFTEMSTQRLAVLQKAYDQAHRQYLLSLQSLRNMKHPQVNVTVKATTANIAQQQIIQENHEA